MLRRFRQEMSKGLTLTDADFGLQSRGLALFESLTPDGSPLGVQAMALEAARLVDRLDELDRIIAGKGVLELMQFRRMDHHGDGSEDEPIVIQVKFDNVLSEARQQAVTLRQILHTLGVGGGGASVTPEQKGSPLDELNARRAARGAGAKGR